MLLPRSAVLPRLWEALAKQDFKNWWASPVARPRLVRQIERDEKPLAEAGEAASYLIA